MVFPKLVFRRRQDRWSGLSPQTERALALGANVDLCLVVAVMLAVLVLAGPPMLLFLPVCSLPLMLSLGARDGSVGFVVLRLLMTPVVAIFLVATVGVVLVPAPIGPFPVGPLAPPPPPAPATLPFSSVTWVEVLEWLVPMLALAVQTPMLVGCVRVVLDRYRGRPKHGESGTNPVSVSAVAYPRPGGKPRHPGHSRPGARVIGPTPPPRPRLMSVAAAIDVLVIPYVIFVSLDVHSTALLASRLGLVLMVALTAGAWAMERGWLIARMVVGGGALLCCVVALTQGVNWVAMAPLIVANGFMVAVCGWVLGKFRDSDPRPAPR